PPRLLDHEGAELLLIGAAEQPDRELGIELDAQEEDLHSAEIINDLRMVKSRHPVEPLLKGQWR
ncbi:MAG: hypothetical protein R3310_16895, partial [Candidatus Competibacteraceae bacterium]|nr:hypothetical protein [Candidatus Competibacteraceae bacterium]